MQTDFISLNACPSANYSQISKYLEKAKSMIPAIHIEIVSNHNSVIPIKPHSTRIYSTFDRPS